MKNDLALFIGKWDTSEGVSIIESHPNVIKSNLEQLAWKIFLFFENFYLPKETKKYEKTLFELPIKERDQLARVLIDSLPSNKKSDKITPYIIVILLPDYFPKDQITDFDEELQLLNQQYRRERTLQLNNYFTRIFNKFNLKQKLQDSEITLTIDYTEKQALEDFKKGLKLFSTKAYKISYLIIKKPYLKFKKDNKIKLLLEATYFLTTILSKLKKFKIALDYCKELKKIAEKLNHQKYYEKALFMGAFCAYKIHNYDYALELFELLNSLELKFIDEFDVYYLYGRLLKILNNYSKSIEIFNKAIDSLDFVSLDNVNKSKLAKTYFELGNSYFLDTAENNLLGSPKKNFNNNFQTIIETYEHANKMLRDLNDYPNLIVSNQIIGNIYEKMEEYSTAITYYKKALNFSTENNDVVSRMQLFDMIINNLMEMDKKEEIIKEIDEMLYKIKTYAFLDLSTIARYHTKLGKVYIDLGQLKDGLSEFLIALNIYNRFENPRKEGLELIKNIISVYSKNNNSKYFEYYKEKYEEYQQKLNDFKREKTKYHPLKKIKDFWLFTLEGEEIFSYTPISKSNPQLFSGFITAMRNFSMELASERLKTVKLGLDQYINYAEKDDPYLIVGRANINDSVKIIRGALKKIYNLFKQNYGTAIESKQYNESTFKGFIEVLQKI